MKRYPLLASLIDDSNNVVEELGYVWINVSNGSGTGSDSSLKTLEQVKSFFSNFMNISDFLSFANVLPPDAVNWNKWVDNFRLLIPTTVILNNPSISGYKLRLLNSSGFYAESVDTVNESFSSIVEWNLYDNKNNFITNISKYGMPLYSSTVTSWLITNDDNSLRYALCYARNFDNTPFGNTEVNTYENPDLFISWLKSLSTENIDPYTKGGESDVGGGTGNFDGTSEDIGIPDLPTLSAVDTGFITLFNPSSGELKNLASYLWGDVFDISTWKKIFADPMDAILGLSIVPVNVPSAGSANVTIGNISTGVSMTKASSQYVSVDCGTINVNEYWGAYLDYSPYTKAEIYLPFIGTHPVTIDDIMGKPVHVVYHIDVLSGACCAYVQCDGTVLYSFVGQCSCSIPITANDWTNVINGALSIAGSIGTMVATGGATAPMAVTNIASTAVNSLKPDVEKSGSMGGMGGMLGVQKPYIILTRPRQAVPAKQNTFTGYPSFITKTLSECSGYTEVESIHLENVPATQNELDEITELLKSGVII